MTAKLSSVDVIVPCYNYAHFLRSCVNSILSQEGVDVRVLIIDDCSPDNTPQVSQELASLDPRVEYRRHPQNIGHIATYNEGIDWVSADYMLLLSADDMITPGSLERAARLLDRHPEVGFVHGKTIRTLNPEQRGFVDTGDDGWTIVPGLDRISQICETGEDVVETPSAVVRTPLQKRLGGYRKELTHSGDMEMWLRFATHGAIGYIHSHQALHRMHPTNMHHAYFGIPEIRQAKAAFDTVFQEHGDRIPNKDELLRRAYAGLGRRAFWKAVGYFDRGDNEGCQALLQEAQSLWPGVKTYWPMTKLRIKRLVGQQLCSMIRALRQPGRRKQVSEHRETPALVGARSHSPTA